MAKVTLGGDCVAVVAVDTAPEGGGHATSGAAACSSGCSTTTSPMRFTATGAWVDRQFGLGCQVPQLLIQISLLTVTPVKVTDMVTATLLLMFQLTFLTIK